MDHKSYMTISEFSRLSGIKRANLIFYDKAGLLIPAHRGENDYRYYTRGQLGSAYLVIALRELGIGLEEIKRYAEGRTPRRMISLLEEQEKKIREEMNRLERLSEVMKIYTEMAEDALASKADKIEIRYLKQEPIFLGPVYDIDRNDDNGPTAFYNFATEQGVELGYPLGSIIGKNDLEQGNTNLIKHYYFKVKQEHNAYKPEGWYAVAYGRCNYVETEPVYHRLLQYIKEHHLTICGDSYEEFPVNEMSAPDEEDYLLKLEIMIERP